MTQRARDDEVAGGISIAGGPGPKGSGDGGLPRWRKTWSGGTITADHVAVCEVSDAILQSLDGVSEFTEAQLVQLAFIHGAPTLLSALDLVDRGTVTVYTSPSAPPIYTVAGSQGREYICLPRTNYCDCEAYRYKVLKAEQPICKHVLAVRIAAATNMHTTTEVDDSYIPELICGPISTVP
eukprot:m.88287 g.88287  ORF g.88287 m.88287 type:complete len:181 (+) comp19975_c0_seq1:317-859(+)